MTQNGRLILVLEYYGTVKKWENLGDLEFGNKFLDTIRKAQSMGKKLMSWISLKLKTSAVWKTMLREWEDKT